MWVGEQGRNHAFVISEKYHRANEHPIGDEDRPSGLRSNVNRPLETKLVVVRSRSRGLKYLRAASGAPDHVRLSRPPGVIQENPFVRDAMPGVLGSEDC